MGCYREPWAALVGVPGGSLLLPCLLLLWSSSYVVFQMVDGQSAFCTCRFCKDSIKLRLERSGKLNRIYTAHMQAFLPLSSRQCGMVTICVAFTAHQKIILSLKGCAEIPCDCDAVLYEGLEHPWIPGPAGILERVSCDS